MGPNLQLSHCAIEIICRHTRWLTGHNKWSAFAWLLAWLLGSILLHSILIALAMLKHSEVKAGYYRSLKDVTHVALLPHLYGSCSILFFFLLQDGRMQCILSLGMQSLSQGCICVLVLILTVPLQRLRWRPTPGRQGNHGHVRVNEFLSRMSSSELEFLEA